MDEEPDEERSWHAVLDFECRPRMTRSIPSGFHCFHSIAKRMPLVFHQWQCDARKSKKERTCLFSLRFSDVDSGIERRLLNLVSIDPSRDRLTSEDKNGFIHESSDRRKHRPANRSML